VWIIFQQSRSAIESLPNRGRLEPREPPIIGDEKVNLRDCGAS
jgi:hypothetical protein